MSIEQIDVATALDGLKDFQLRTVEYVFRRLYLDEPPATRFLVADEVGLGKTLVARGIIAKTVEHLREKGSTQIDVLYICSNASIAQQNLNKLNITNESDDDNGEEANANTFATRLTLLPMQLGDFKENGVNFISFTPGTTFDLKGRGGRADERALIFQMLNERLRIRSSQLFRVLQCSASLKGWNRWARQSKLDYDQTLADRYAKSLTDDADFMKRLQTVCNRFHRVKRVSPELKNDRLRIVGEMRRRLADICIEALEPDLVILDEFQRFKELLHGDQDDPAAQLAQQLFRYKTEHGNVRILLLSATPYRMMSMDHEQEDDHYADFLETLRFLLDGDDASVGEITTELRRFRQALYGLNAEAPEQAKASRDRLEKHLRAVIARTERIDMTKAHNAMLIEKHEKPALAAEDLLAARFVDRIAQCVDAGDTVEYWKSSPYLINFMDQYELKKKVLEECKGKVSDELRAAMAGADGQLLRGGRVQKYHQVAANNPRLRSLMDATVNAGQWQWLWLPPALPYLAPRGVYAQDHIPATKALIFSNWQVVPDAIAALCSFETERLMIQGAKELPRYRELHKKRRPLLQFRLDAEKKTPAAMPALALVYPCATLAALIDPMALALEVGNGRPADLDIVRVRARERVVAKLAALPPGDASSVRADERWYWAAPALLDAAFAEEALDWIADESKGLSVAASTEDEAGAALKQHVELLRHAAQGDLNLGRRPDDLADVLVNMALAAPGICAMRSLQRMANDLPETSMGMLSAATTIATGLRTLFNQPEVTEMLRAGDDGDGEDADGKYPYWQRVLDYCIEGNLQAVLDEFVHILKESEGLTKRPGEKIVEAIAAEISEALSLRSSTLRADEFKVRGRSISKKPLSMRCRFALRFGDVRDNEGATLARSGSVRRAFNSPFRPFILASTSVGQEGLDFHQYCHVVYHWNLPSNPVDLEQREGRVHRYKGHAIRRNVAKAYGLASLRSGEVIDPWEALFARAAADRKRDASELIPYWLFEVEGGHSIERRVPLLPLSREIGQLRRLKRMLAVYRLAFGQPRQEELLCYLVDSSEQRVMESSSLRLRLTPPPTDAEQNNG